MPRLLRHGTQLLSSRRILHLARIATAIALICVGVVGAQDGLANIMQQFDKNDDLLISFREMNPLLDSMGFINPKSSCPSRDGLFEAYDVDMDGFFTQTEMESVTNDLAWGVVHGCTIPSRTCNQLTPTEVWGYSLLSVALYSLTSFAGLALIPFDRRARDNRKLAARVEFALTAFIGFGIGAMVGDSMLHILPTLVAETNRQLEEDRLAAASGGKSTSSHGASTALAGMFYEPAHAGHQHGQARADGFGASVAGLGPAMMVLSGVMFFFTTEKCVRYYVDKIKKQKKARRTQQRELQQQPVASAPRLSVSESTTSRTGLATSVSTGTVAMDDVAVAKVEAGPGAPAGMPAQPDALLTSLGHHSTVVLDDADIDAVSDDDQDDGVNIAGCGHLKPAGIVNLVADAVHNFTDGLGIGAAFSTSASIGIATTIAIVFHEIPQELGDFGILLRSGFNKRQALKWNFFSALTGFLGCLVALLIGSASENASIWLLAFTGGGFLYVALADMLPELMKDNDPMHSLYFGLAILGGIFVMFLLAVFYGDVQC